MPALPDIDEIFSDAIDLDTSQPPLEDSASVQPDTIITVAELTDSSDPPALTRQADSEIAFIERPFVDSELDTATTTQAAFPVKITSVFTSFEGNATNPANFTYVVEELDGTVHAGAKPCPDAAGNAILPLGKRIPAPVGSYGLGGFDFNGDFILMSVCEVPDAAACP